MSVQASSTPQMSDELIARRKEVFKLFDDADISPSHVRVCLVASAGFFTDGYNLCSVFPMTVYAFNVHESIPVMILYPIWIGAILGNLLFGYMTDKYGRKKMFGVEMIIVIIGSVFSAIAGQSPPTVSFVGTLFFCQFILGVGIGGDYPISALIISELAPIKFRGTMLATGFTIFMFGALSAEIVSFIALVAFRASVHQDARNFDYVWRLTTGLGAVPAMIALYFRLSIPETPRYLIDVEKEIDWARNIEVSQIGNYESPRLTHYTSRKNHLRNMYHYFRSGKSGKYLMITSLIWFCANISSIESINYVPIIINISKGDDSTYNGLLEYNLNAILWLFLCYVPGPLLTVFLIDRWGRKPILYIGFVACAVLLVLWGLLIGFAHIDTSEDQRLYYTVATVYLFFLSFGPRTIAFVMSAELFPTRYRSTAYGISAAVWKISFMFFTAIFQWIGDVNSYESHMRLFVTYIVCAVFMVIGAASTTLLPETKNEPLEEIADDDDLKERVNDV